MEPFGPGIAYGSRVQTRRGEVLAENLSVGEQVLTARGRFRTVRSVRIDRPPAASAVRITRDAFGSMRPACDVVVTPDQTLLTENFLATASSLVNGRTVLRCPDAPARLVGIVLDEPDCMIVDGLAISSMADAQSGSSTNTAACAAIPSSRPVKPSRSVVVALTDTRPTSTWSSMASRARIASE